MNFYILDVISYKLKVFKYLYFFKLFNTKFNFRYLNLLL